MAERCRNLESSPGSASGVRSLLRDEGNYQVASVKLIFDGRSEAETGRSISLNAGLVRFEAGRHAAANETITMECLAGLASREL